MITSWKEVESYADENGFIPESIYNENISNFRVCPPQDEEVSCIEAEIWRDYLSARRNNSQKTFKYEEMYRYEWYEGRTLSCIYFI